MSNATYRLEPLVSPSSFMLHSPWVKGWGVDLRAASDTHRFGFWHASQSAIPDEDPPGNQVTPRVQKLQLLSHSLQRFALMLTPRSIPGEVVSPRILRHAPSCYILVTQRALDLRQTAPEPHWHRTTVQVWWWDGLQRVFKHFVWLKVD